jgi:gamma-glutamyltranspeptidase/glutathione hydrolase
MLVLNVTDAGSFCFGGEVPIIVYDAKRKVTEVIAGQGVAPRLATYEYFKSRGGIPRGGVQAAAVPGAPDAYITLLSRYGTKRLADVAVPMLRELDKRKSGWQPNLANTVRQMIAAEARSPDDRLRGLRLAADCFYRGPIARRLDEWCRANNGLLRYADLATHTTRIEEPVAIQYRGHRIVKCGPWTQGPMLLQTLRLLEPLDLKKMGHNRPDYVHQVVEAMKLSFADRDVYYADPLVSDVPLEQLLSKSYADVRRALIDPDKASRLLQPGDPVAGKALAAKSNTPFGLKGSSLDTTNCLTADQWGNVVAATPSGWGGAIAGDTGIALGSRLQSLNTWAGHPNCIAAGKRPRITLTPTMVFKQDKPVLAICVAGGDGQEQATLQVLLNHLEFGMTPAEAVHASRFGTSHFIGSFSQPPPRLGSLSMENNTDTSIISELKKRGHRVTTTGPPFWQPCALGLDPKTGLKHAAGDPRAKRNAAAY